MSLFSSGRFAVHKNTTDNKLKKTFSSLKNSVHVEPVWFSLDNLTLCGRFNYRSMVFHAIKKISDALKLFSFEGDDFFLIVFLKYRDKLSTKQTSSDKLEIPFGTNFLRVLIFTMFTIFLSAIRKNKFPQKIIKRKHFSRKNLLQSIKYTLSKIYYTKKKQRNRVCSITTRPSIQKQNGIQ